MRCFHTTLVVTVALAVAGCHKTEDPTNTGLGWELKLPAPDATPVTAKKKMPGIYPAGSRIKNRDALGGFGSCNNYPKDLGGNDWGAKSVVSIVAFPDEPVAYFKHRGFAVR